MFPQRSGRLAHELQQEIAQIIQRELKDPRVGFITVTQVELSKDGSHAKVFFSCLGGEAAVQQAQDVLDHSAAFIRTLIKKRFRLKVIPALAFRYDEMIERSIRMAETLDELKRRDEDA